MKTNFIIIALLTFSGISAQQKNVKSVEKVTTRFEKSQPQDQSVPPPPISLFPAQFPGGNKLFIKKVAENMDQNYILTLKQNAKTQLILKIDQAGNVINISTFGPSETFNEEVHKAATKTTSAIVWQPSKNKAGINTIDIVKLPFTFKIKE
ncbi:hypothetical protein [Chryseobacterium sp. MP_3.2]|uniref:hypothetical protein n=1 Tax=Chryseobacterium sp. MP_3.2 TaxID=3071712 RepID=UPI002E0118F1|nr:hypothetical protein [Chryseobacterium sp. MP_3.2]